MPKEEANSTVSKGVKRRITQACILCRKKKIKCDGAKPECVHCLDANLQCQYTEYKKRGPHKGYVKLLEERLAQLEDRLARAGGEIPPPISAAISPHSPFNSPPLKEKLNRPNHHHTSSSTALTTDDFPPEEIVTHLVDLFFQNINSVFPFVHRGRLKQSIKDGNVSKPLLWSVMAISARFSNHPSIKTDPPYWAGERFATKATSLIDVSLLEPTLSNLQFWGIMSCLEYGRASGSKAWTFGGIAVRICQELGLHKEETLKQPILSSDGTIDYVAMALRRRIFWSCLCIDKFASTSTNRPQGFASGDYDAEYSTHNESKLLSDPLQGFTVDKQAITTDPLMDFIPHYVTVLENFGEVCKGMSRAKTDNTTVTWPPIRETYALDTAMKNWRDKLPDKFKFTPANVQLYRDTASQNYLNFWLCSHAMYCTGMLALHRGSLAYSDLTTAELPKDVYDRIQGSIQSCKANVDIAMEVFRALRDICGCNVLPYMGYCAYIFSTVLMTSAFSSDPVSYRKSSAGLTILFDTIKLLCPYWPMCERLAITTRDMLSAHSRLYDVQQDYSYDTKRIEDMQTTRPDIDAITAISGNVGSLLPPSTSSTSSSTLSYASNLNNSNNNNSNNNNSTASMLPPLNIGQMQQQQQMQTSLIPQTGSNNNNTTTTNNNYHPQAHAQQAHQQHHPQPPPPQPQQFVNSDIDFNSCEFLYDSALFGQIMFGNSSVIAKPHDMKYMPSQHDQYSMILNTSTINTAPMYQPQIGRAHV